MATGLSGCVALRVWLGIGYERPKVELVEARVDKVTWQSVEMHVALRLANPNDFVFEFADLKYAAQMADRQFASGKYDRAFTLPAEGEYRLELPIRIDSLEALRVMQDVLKQKETKLRLVGTANFISAFGKIGLEFDEETDILP